MVIKMYQDLKNQIIRLLAAGTRLDGRKPLDYREITIKTGVSKNAEGSAKVCIGETEVIAGVKMEVMKPYPDTPDEGSLMVNVELYPISNPSFEGGPPSIDAIELARITDRAIRECHAIDMHKLCIESGEKMWVVVVDICTLNDAGNLFDACSLAAMAAIKDAVYPGFDGEVIDYKNKTDQKLPLTDKPLNVTVFKYGEHFLTDPTIDELKVYDARLTVGITSDGNLCSLQKGGEEPLTKEEILTMVDIALEKSEELRAHLG